MKNENKIIIDDIIIDKVILAKRKTLLISINPEAKVIVKAPLRTSMNQIRLFVLKKSNWIKSKQKHIQHMYQRIKKAQFSYGENFRYLGKNYPLRYSDKSENPLYFDGNSFVLSLDYIENAEQLFINWYKNKAYNYFQKRLDYYSQISGLEYYSFRLSNAKKRWGSCSSNKKINLNWKLIIMPEDVIDYVIVHELAHTRELNHSKKFWDIVKHLFPDYKNSIKWLRENEYLIEI